MATMSKEDLLEVFALDAAPELPKFAIDMIRKKGPHTLPLALTFWAQRTAERMPQARNAKAIEAGKRLTHELEETIEHRQQSPRRELVETGGAS